MRKSRPRAGRPRLNLAGRRETGLQFLKQALLIRGQMRGNLDGDPADQIPPLLVLERWHTLARKPQQGTVRGRRSDWEWMLSMQGLDLHDSAQREQGISNGKLAVQIPALTPEPRVGPEVNLHVEIPARLSRLTRLTLT